MRIAYAGLWVAVAFLSGATLMQAIGVGWRMPHEASVMAANDSTAKATPAPDSLPGTAVRDSRAGAEPEKQAERETPAQAEAEVPKEPVEKRIVPVVSLGDGARIGAVQVVGPKSYVDQVKVVVQLEGDYKNVVRYRALIPIKTEKVIEKIERVPFVAISGIVDLKVS